MAFVLFLTQSRNAFLALSGALVAAWLWERLSVRSVILLFVLLLLLPFLLLMTNGPELQTAVGAFDFETKAGPVSEPSWLRRLEMWKVASEVMADYPLPGAGLYTFAAIGRANYVYEMTPPYVSLSHAHNLFLQTASSLGWPGLAALACLWGAILFCLRRERREKEWLWRAPVVAVVAYLLFNAFDVLALEQRAGLFVWLLLALAAAEIAGEPMRDVPEELSHLWLVPLVVALALAPALPQTLARLQLDRARLAVGPAPHADQLRGDPRRLGLRHYLAANEPAALEAWRADKDAVAFLTSQAAQAVYAGDSRLALRWCQMALQLDESAPAAYFWRGEAYRELGEGIRALDDYRVAVATVADEGETVYGVSLEALAWERQGQLLTQLEEWRAAVEAFSEAARLAPNIAYYQRQLEDAQQMLARSEEGDER